MQVKGACYQKALFVHPAVVVEKSHRCRDVFRASILQDPVGGNGSSGLQKRTAMWSYVSGYWN
jgi:hypothetical protein